MPRNSSSNSNGSRLCILGVDPAAAGATGYGVVEFLGSAPRLLRFGALKFPARAAFGWRLREIHDLISQLVEEFAPDAIAVESVFTALNMGTALRLAEVRGVILLAAAQASIPAHSYSPREVKSSITGYGAASKQQMQQMVSSALGLTEYPEPPDAADALAVALCHAHLARAQERMAIAMKIQPAKPLRTANAAAAIASGEAAIRAPKHTLRNQTRAARISGL
jgi:crossover junction endodeoxyribonuclease RuvC